MAEIRPASPPGTSPGGPAVTGAEAGAASSEGTQSGSLDKRFRPWIGNILLTVAIGVVIAGLVWYFNQSDVEGASESVTLQAQASGPAPRVGSAAPDFRLTGMGGEEIQLSQFKGHPVWINFWATWCPPCRAEMPEIEAAYQKYKDEGLIILAVNLGESPDVVRDYLARTGLTFLVVLDRSEEVAAQYRLLGLPSHYFIDSEGTLTEMRIGAMAKKTMDEKVRALLDDSGVSD